MSGLKGSVALTVFVVVASMIASVGGPTAATLVTVASMIAFYAGKAEGEGNG